MKQITIVQPEKHFAMSKDLQENFLNAELKSINPEKKPLTVETLRSFEGMENLTDEEANEIVFSLQLFSGLFHEFYIQLEKMKISGEIDDIISYLINEGNTNEHKQAA